MHQKIDLRRNLVAFSNRKQFNRTLSIVGQPYKIIIQESHLTRELHIATNSLRVEAASAQEGGKAIWSLHSKYLSINPLIQN